MPLTDFPTFLRELLYVVQVFADGSPIILVSFLLGLGEVVLLR